MKHAALEGGCHCGRVRFRVDVVAADPGQLEALDCNCSICAKKGFLHFISGRDAFEITRGADALTTYTFNTGVAKHTFCSVCGIHPFYTPRSHPDAIDVNVRCLDGDALARFNIVPFDGAEWEANVDKIR